MLAIETILYPTDLSPSAAAAFPAACSLARDYHARLVVLHVMEPLVPVYSDMGLAALLPENWREDARKELAGICTPDKRVKIEHRLEEGEAASEILRVAEEIGADMIVMGTHGRRGIGRLLMGSVAEQVLRKADCPVLTIKAPGAAPSEMPQGAGAASVS